MKKHESFQNLRQNIQIIPALTHACSSAVGTLHEQSRNQQIIIDMGDACVDYITYRNVRDGGDRAPSALTVAYVAFTHVESECRRLRGTPSTQVR
jgi:hypothetical protein